jgi:hypothetical protein
LLHDAVKAKANNGKNIFFILKLFYIAKIVKK